MHSFQVIHDFSNFFIKPEVTKRRFLRQVASQVKYNGGFYIADFLLMVYYNICSNVHRFQVIRDVSNFFIKPEVTMHRCLRYVASGNQI